MKKQITLVIYLLVIIALSQIITAMQPQQSYSQIYLSPFYQANLVAGTNYTYTLSVNPPDGISSVKSAIISWNAQINGQTQTFTLWVNNKSCNNPSYSVATAYSTTGNVQFAFDCSNVINKAGNYTVTMKSAVNTGAMTGWLDLTYMNNPQGDINVMGTEYFEGDDGTIFLLLKDANGLPISNATCTIDVYYPQISPNTTHPEWINDGIMMYLEEGLYYYDFVVPEFAGLYMVNAKCQYTTTNNFYYTLSSGLTANRTIISGTYTGDPFVLNDYQEWLYTQCDSSTGGTKACDSWYEWTINPNVSSLGVVYLGESTVASTMILYYWNWTASTWIALPNTLIFKATASGSVPSGVDEYLSNTLPLGAINTSNNKVRVRTYTSFGSTFKLFSNWLSLRTSQLSSNIQELKGSGEVHVNGRPAGMEGTFYKVISCDGFSDGRCGNLTNDNEFDLREGEIEDRFDILALSTRSGTSIIYNTPFTVDCSAIYWIKEWNGTAWIDFTNYDVYSQPAYENCIVTIKKDVVVGNNYSFLLKMDNYMKWEVDWTKQMADATLTSLDELCLNRNFTYDVPITENTNLSGDTITDFCYYSYDDQYWLNTFYNDSQSITLVGEYASYVQELRFYRSSLFSRIDWLQDAIMSPINIYDILLNMNYTQNNINSKVNLIDERLINFSIITNQTLQSILSTIINDYNLTSNQINNLYSYLQSVNYNMTTRFDNLQNLLNQISSTTNYTSQQITSMNATINQNIMNTQSLITNINQTILYRFNITDNKIDNLQMALQNQLNNLETNLTNKLNEIKNTLQQIWIQVNLTDSRLISFSIITNQTLQEILTAISTDYNLTSQELSQIQNYLISMNNNISINCQEIQNQLTSISGQQNITFAEIQSINTTINQNIFDTQNMITSLNQTMISQFNITNNKIDNLQIDLTNQLTNLQANLTNQMNEIMNYLIIINQTTTETLSIAQQIWAYITSWLNGTINQIEFKLDLLLNASNITITPTTITQTNNAPCITGSDWIIEATVKGNYNQNLDNTTTACNITTSIWGLANMNYKTEGYFEYRNTCPIPSNWTWDITCNNI